MLFRNIRTIGYVRNIVGVFTSGATKQVKGFVTNLSRSGYLTVNMCSVRRNEQAHVTVEKCYTHGIAPAYRHRGQELYFNVGAGVYKEEREVLMKSVRTGNAYYAVLRNRKRAIYVSTEKYVWHRHANMRIIEEMDHVQLNDGAEVYKGKTEIQMKAVRRGNTYYIRSKKWKGSTYVPTEKDVWHRHTNMRIIEEMENEQSGLGNYKTGIMGLWHIELIGPVRPMLKGDKELWVKETPKTCRNFIQLCMDGYWDDTIFHRIIKGFITHGGDPTDIGEGGKIYGEPFKEDFRTRLRFCGRGLIAGGYVRENDNGFQFFFTLGSTLEFHNKHTIFCKGTEETICNMLKLEEALVDENDKPLYPPRLIKPTILNNQFSDIIPRIIVQECEGVKESSEIKTAMIQNQAHNQLSNHLDLHIKKGKEGSGDWESDDEVKTQEKLEVIKKEKVVMKRRRKNTLRDTRKEPKKVQNYKIGNVEDDKGIKENE
ncbi:Peptidyl-prolyl cis-trans isomerase CWC27 like protein [Eufriesea mexicana]|uniref:Spliceosome-associated protein CWC27 homolog n=1 Tax=Eufriesea mexicana TaxID=516756 RepID=A0A310S3X2_9HYME|nr:Peptidyl-prolyl cis-trans isomerase CWC27 like protein [Eufriesea mexicana]